MQDDRPFDKDSPNREVAQHNAWQKEMLQYHLTDYRGRNIRIADMAGRMGISIEKLREQEVYYHEWTLLEVTFYALCLGVKVNFSIETPKEEEYAQE